MSRILKLLIGLVLILVVAIGGVLFALPPLVNDFKPDIERIAQEQTGLTLRLQGDIGVSLFPIFGVSIADVDVLQPDGERFAAVTDLRLAVAILPLFSGQLQVDKVALDGATLRLHRDAQGRANWDIIAETQAKRQKAGAEASAVESSEATTPDSAEAPADSGAGAADAGKPVNLPDIDIALIQVSNTAVEYRDEVAGQAVKLEDLDLSVRDLRFDEWFPVTLSYRLDNQAPQVSLSHTFDAELKIGKDLKVFGLQDLQTALNVQGEPTQGKLVKVSLAGDAEVDLNRNVVAVPELVLGLDESRVTTKAQIDLTRPQVTVALQGDTLDLTRYLPAAPAPAEGGGTATAKSASTAKAKSGAVAAGASAPSSDAAPSSHPFEALRKLNLDATVKFDKIILPGQVIEDLDLAFTGQDGLLTLSRSNLVLNGEKLASSLTVDARQASVDTVKLAAAFKGLKIDANLNTLLQFEPARERAQFKDLVLGVNQIRVTGNPGVQGFGAPQLFGAIDIPAFSPREVMSSFGVKAPETSNPAALSKVAFSTRLGGAPNVVELQDLKLQLDRTQFSGAASVDLKTQAIRGKLAGDAITLDDYLPPPSPEAQAADLPIPVPPAESAPAGAPADSRDPNAPLLPLETLRGLDAELGFTLRQLVFKEYQTQNMDILVTAKSGLIELKRANAALYDGTLVTSAALDARSDDPTWVFNTKLANVNADKFPKSLTRQEFLFGLLKIQPQGKINVSADYQSKGNTLGAVVDNARATMDLYLEKGAIEELKSLTKLYQLAARFNSEVTDPASLVAATPFKDLQTDFTLEGSKLRQNSYTLQLNKDADVEGSGNIDLLRRTLKYDFRLKPTAAFVQKGNKWATALVDIPLNYTCTADLNQSPVPSCGVDDNAIEDAVKAHAKAELKAKGERKLDQLLERKLGPGSDKPEAEKTDKEKQQDALKDAGKQLLKGLFNN